ncbi:hypothetical protein ABL78_3830 [Leptomonas seymouri]|uniref:Uncharacterized protein n=1 Tax=Leptomonas seymouri TaxID=5684 RepID=A0A0N1IKQ4_LEPSE|nr:hypothetical protein ABL78_3830 [Leptomonas seymouri]|eukprot:KPI87068.1 hypothetical protein ABL78_3830 [Leptomonas seymouri]
MARERPATFSSTPSDGRGRIGARSPSLLSNHNNNNGAPKARAKTASSNFDVDDALLPLILPVRRIRSPQRKQQQQQENLRTPSKKKKPIASVTPMGTPRPACAQEGKPAHRVPTGVRASDAGFAVRAAASPAAAAEVATPPQRPSKILVPRNSTPTDGRQPLPCRRRPTAPPDSARASVIKERANNRKAMKPEEEAELTTEEIMLLCGVQPGSSKALWFTSMRSQLESRATDTAGHLAETEDLCTSPAASRRAHTMTPPSAGVSCPTGHTSIHSAVPCQYSPLQVPEELLGQEKRGSNGSHPAPARVGTLPPPPPSLPSAPSFVSAPPRAASQTLPSSSTVDDSNEESSEKDEEGDPVDDSDSISTTHGTDEDVSEATDGEEEPVNVEGVDDDSGEQYFPFPATLDGGTRKPISEAADLLVQLRVAVANRKAELLPVNDAGSHLRHLRLSSRQLQECRVQVLSLEHGAGDL